LTIAGIMSESHHQVDVMQVNLEHALQCLLIASPNASPNRQSPILALEKIFTATANFALDLTLDKD
jgi:hypothetical protein